MKIALLLHKYFPYGGLQRDCLNLALRLSACGHEVSIACRTWDGDRPDGVEVVCFGKRGWTNLAMDKRFEVDARQWLSTTVFDCVVAFSRVDVGADYYYAADPCYVERVKRTKPEGYLRTKRYLYMRDLEKAIFARGGKTKVLLLTSMEIADYQRIYDTETERMTVLPPSIKRRELNLEAKEQLREAVRNRMNWGSGEKIILFVGSGFATKGLDRAIEAVKSTDEGTKLVVAGSGKTGKYQQQANRLGLSDRVYFLGARDDAWELMVGADLLLHPARSENTGTVLVESLSAGTPVVATDRCGFSNHVLASGAGQVTASPFVQDQLNAALESVLKIPWRDSSAKALQYALTEDLYSGMETAVAEILGDSQASPAESDTRI